MTDSIFLLQHDGSLVAAPNTPYPAEDDLQTLISEHPELLPGALISPDNPRRWLLLRREAPVPDREGAGGCWALDHLLVDQDAVPTLVEVKRSSDPRVRREVVAQLLEYAANGTAYWETAVVRGWFESAATSLGHDPSETIARFVVARDDEDAGDVAARFWGAFETNLRGGRIRLLFVADALPRELRRLIEFLNGQMTTVEVLGVELPQYVGAGGAGLRALVPRLIGQTEQAQARKAVAHRAAPRAEAWTVDEIIGMLVDADRDARPAAERVIAWARERGDIDIRGNRGATWPTLGFRPLAYGGRSLLFNLIGFPNYFIEIPLRSLTSRAPYDTSEERRQLHAFLAPFTRMAQGDPETEAYAYVDTDAARRGQHLEDLLAFFTTYLDRTVRLA